MGEMAKKISKVDNKELLNLLNVAFAEEWLAYYQYWVGAHVVVGPMSMIIADEFKKHANEELEHPEMLAVRISQLGGTPLLRPSDWEKYAQCKYEAPADEYIENVVKQNLASERCAIDRYQKICEMTFGKDFETFRVAKHILEEELDHEQDMENYLADFDAARKHMVKK